MVPPVLQTVRNPSGLTLPGRRGEGKAILSPGPRAAAASPRVATRGHWCDMSLLSFASLYQRADALRDPLPVAVAGGADATVLEALEMAHARGWVTPHVVGREADVRQAAQACGVDLRGFLLSDADDPAPAAVAL